MHRGHVASGASFGEQVASGIEQVADAGSVDACGGQMIGSLGSNRASFFEGKIGTRLGATTKLGMGRGRSVSFGP